MIWPVDRPELLRRCLDSLRRQTASPDGYDLVVAEGGDARSRNDAVARTTGSVLLFLAGDTEADPGLVESHLAMHREQRARVGVGAVDRVPAARAGRLAQGEAAAARLRIEQLSTRTPQPGDCASGNFSLARGSFEGAGGFDGELTDLHDVELVSRVRRSGAALLFLPDARVRRESSCSDRAIVLEARRRGRRDVGLYERRPELLPHLQLGGFGESTTRPRGLVRRALLACRIPPSLLRLATLAIPPGRLRAWHAILRDHAYWTSVRRHASRDLWRRARSASYVLCYHAFTTPSEQPGLFVVAPERLAAQLRWLRRLRFNVIGMPEFLGFRLAHRLPPPRTVVVTIDDGYLDAATVARPILERYGAPATLFLVVDGAAARANHDVPALSTREVISPADAGALLGEGFEVGGHTLTHPHLAELPPPRAEFEIAGSKRELERVLGAPVTTFAYPYGESNATVRRLVEEAGFLAGFGVRGGGNRPATDTFDLRRISVSGFESAPHLAARLLLADLCR